MEKNIAKQRAIVIGGSAGSLHVILYILSHLKPDICFPIIIILHLKNDPDSGLTDVMNQTSVLKVKEAEDKEAILPGVVYVAPADYHLLVEQNFSFSLDVSEKVLFSRPSIDVTFQTAAEAYGNGLMAILLSGASEDGTEGLNDVKANSGVLVVHDPKEATVPYMPQNALNNITANYILNKQEIVELINAFDDNANEL